VVRARRRLSSKFKLIHYREVTSVNDSTREITLLYTNAKGKTESFVATLQEGYKVTLKDGSAKELKVSAIPPGRRLRIYYMNRDRKVDGRREKIHEIFRIDFLPAVGR
jgi:hypothetical protein